MNSWYGLAFVFGLFLFGFAPNALSAERVALVIGNGKYENANALPNPPTDARKIAAALRDINFEVLEGEDLDRVSMERKLRDFLRAAQGAKIALFFYAGHGMEVGGQNYLVPVDASLETASDLSFETIGMNKILNNLDDPNRANIIILDACRDNPLARSFRARIGATRSVNVGNGLAAYSSVGTGTLIALATAPGQVALDGEGEDSPFTTGLLKYLRTPGLEVRQMLTRVRRDVLSATGNQQQPWDNSSLLGDVYLAGPPASASNPGTALPPQTKTASLAPGSQQQKILDEAEKLRQQAAAELEKARQAATELERARQEAEQAAKDAAQQRAQTQEAERQRSAALIPRNDPTVRPQKDNNPHNRFAAVAISKSSLSWGAGYNYQTQDLAEQRALAECGKYAKDCRVVQWVRNACLSLAIGKNAYGHSWNDVLKKAENESVQWCRKYGAGCKVAYSVCSYAQ